VVLPVKLRRPYVEWLHTDLGHFGKAKTYMAIARCAYFPGWRSFTGMLVRTCPTCNMHHRSHQRPQQANLEPMREFHPMAVIHADLVGPLPEGKNSRNQRGFQYILSVIDSATCYLWLLPIRHKTAECVAATAFDEVISHVSVPSAILTDQGGEFMGEVVESLLQRLGMTTDTNTDSQSVNVCMPTDLVISVDTAIISSLPELSSQSTDAAADTEAVSTISATKPLPLSAGHPSRIHCRPSRYLDNIQTSASLIS